MILAVVSDLMFSVQIGDMAKKLGVPVVFASTPESAIAKLSAHPRVVVLDLNLGSGTPMAVLGAIRDNPQLVGTTTIGFVPHVRIDLKNQALEAGCGVVLARSVFAEKLPGLLAKALQND